MKIFYGVQGTGNGHITRARGMAKAFKKYGVDVDFLFSGRDPAKYFDMDVFGNYRMYPGLTFATKEGRIQLLATLLQARPLTFLKDMWQLDLSPYDLVISDYEPITAWAGKKQGIDVIGLGHQYAFHHPIPQHFGSPVQRLIINYFAPVSCSLGFHWHHFNQPILPPIAPVDEHNTRMKQGVYLVYLPFESLSAITTLLKPFKHFEFHIYHPEATESSDCNLHWHPPGRATFQCDLATSEGVICNAGFELASEVLNLGRKLLVKPVTGQSEQASNALALDILGYGHVMFSLNNEKVASWLEHAQPTKVVFPDVADAICQWLLNGASSDIAELSKSLWAETRLPDITGASRTDKQLGSIQARLYQTSNHPIVTGDHAL